MNILGKVAHAYNPNTWEEEAGRSGISGYSWLYAYQVQGQLGAYKTQSQEKKKPYCLIISGYTFKSLLWFDFVI